MLQTAVTAPAFTMSLSRIGSAAMPKERATPRALATYLRQEMERWAPILQAARIRGE